MVIRTKRLNKIFNNDPKTTIHIKTIHKIRTEEDKIKGEADSLTFLVFDYYFCELKRKKLSKMIVI